MENHLVDSKLAIKIITSINEINRIIKSCGSNLDDKKLKQITNDFTAIAEIIENIYLHNNIIDSILILLCKTIELIINTKSYLIDTNEIITLTYKVLQVKQINDSITSKWKFVESLFNCFILFLDLSEQGNLNYNDIVKILYVIFIKMDGCKKLSIMPGFISKLI
jgi:hypothetical protein